MILGAVAGSIAGSVITESVLNLFPADTILLIYSIVMVLVVIMIFADVKEPTPLKGIYVIVIHIII